MSGLLDLFQWERFITPSIIKVFYALVVVIALLYGLSGVLEGARDAILNPLGGLFTIIVNLVGMLAAIVLTRITSEFVLVMFRVNEHLGAIRSRGGM